MLDFSGVRATLFGYHGKPKFNTLSFSILCLSMTSLADLGTVLEIQVVPPSAIRNAESVSLVFINLSFQTATSYLHFDRRNVGQGSTEWQPNSNAEHMSNVQRYFWQSDHWNEVFWTASVPRCWLRRNVMHICLFCRTKRFIVFWDSINYPVEL